MTAELSAQEIAAALNIDEVSANEMLNGRIEFFSEELYALAIHKGISVSELVTMLTSYA